MTMDAKTDQMIALVMQINGYAKADDLHTLPLEERTIALRSYYQDHAGNSALHWRGEQLWAGTEAPDNSFFAETPPQTVPTAAAVDPYPTTATEPFHPGSYGMPDAGGPDMFGDLAPTPQLATVGVATLEPLVAATPLSAEPIFAEPEPYAPAIDSRLETDFLPDPVGSPAPSVVEESPVSPWWWVLAVLWAPLGGLIGYLVMKSTNPRGAARVLKVSLLVWGFSILLGVALAVVPMLLG
jgi:hypothetical protein